MNNYPLSVTFKIEMVVTGTVVDFDFDPKMPAVLADKIRYVAQEFFNEENASKKWE